MRDGIRALIKKLKDSEEDIVEEEYCNKLGFIPRFKSPRTWEAVSRLGTADHQEGRGSSRKIQLRLLEYFVVFTNVS